MDPKGKSISMPFMCWNAHVSQKII